MKTLVGIRPTGKLHLGHYFSVIKPAREEGADVLIARYHAPFCKWEEMNAELLSFGITPIIQDVDIDLYFKLLDSASYGELSRMTQFKDKGGRNAHLFVYPVLMACDLVGYDRVIVGEDQRQHIEFARRLLGSLKIRCPEPDYRGGRIMSLTDPTKKMSKSEPGGCLFLDDDIEKKIKKAVTTEVGLKNLEYIASQFGFTWDGFNNAYSKKKLALVIKKTLNRLRINHVDE